jgi:hypothetical protein
MARRSLRIRYTACDNHAGLASWRPRASSNRYGLRTRDSCIMRHMQCTLVIFQSAVSCSSGIDKKDKFEIYNTHMSDNLSDTFSDRSKIPAHRMTWIMVNTELTYLGLQFDRAPNVMHHSFAKIFCQWDATFGSTCSSLPEWRKDG